MKSFMIVLANSMLAFIVAFYLIGKNQTELDDDNEDKLKPIFWNDVGSPKYSTALGAIDHVIQSVFAEFDTDSYFNNPMTKFIYPLFILMVFCECIILLNILIAVMNNSFSQNSVKAESITRIKQLEFVINNWWV